MTKFQNKMIHFVATLGLVICLSANLQAATISLRADDWYPYNGNPTRGKTGYMIDIATQIAAENGHKIDYSVQDWDQAISDARAGKIDCIVGASRADVAEFNFPTEPLGSMINSVYALQSKNLKVSRVSELSKYRLGIAKDYSYGPEIDELIESLPAAQIKAVSAHSRPVVINMLRLVKGEIDVVIEDENVASAFLAALGIQDSIANAGRVSTPDSLYIACQPKSVIGKQFVDQLGTGLRTMRKDGRLAKILAKYNLKDWSN